MKTLRITSATLAIIAAAVLACGCSERKPDYDYGLIGGVTQDTSSDYDVDIRKDTDSEPTDSSDQATGTNSGTESKPAVTPEPGDTSKPDTTPSRVDIKDTEVPKKDNTSLISTDTSTTPEEKPQSTVSKPEEKPKDNTSSEPAASSSPSESKFDENGFPANPVVDQTFYDGTGQKWVYDWIFGWIKSSDGPAVIMEDFPRHGDYTYGEGEIILH